MILIGFANANARCAVALCKGKSQSPKNENSERVPRRKASIATVSEERKQNNKPTRQNRHESQEIKEDGVLVQVNAPKDDSEFSGSTSESEDLSDVERFDANLIPLKAIIMQPQVNPCFQTDSSEPESKRRQSKDSLSK